MHLGITLGLNRPATRKVDTGPLEVTNNQKLSLPANTAVGTQVSVSDGFVVSGFGDARDAFYYYDTDYGGTNGTARYLQAPFRGDDNDITVRYSGGVWQIGSNNNGRADSDAIGADSDPWGADFSGAGAILAHPAIQQLAAPSSAITGEFVTGVGIFTQRGTLNSKAYYNLLGAADDSVTSAISWTGLIWTLYDDAGSPSDTGTDGTRPDQATWALSTVTGIEQGAMVAGLTVSGAGTSAINGSMVNNGSVSTDFGPRYYYNLVGVAANAADDSVFMHSISKWTVGGSDQLYLNNSTEAFPFGLTFTVNNGDSPAPSVTRNNVATEANWDNV